MTSKNVSKSRGGGVLDPCLGIRVSLRVEILTLFRTRNYTLKTLPCVGQQLPFHDPV